MKLLLKYRYYIIVLTVLVPRIAWFLLLGGGLPEPPRDQNLYLPISGRILEGEGISYGREMGLLRNTMAREAESLSNWTRDPEYIFGIIPVETPTASMEPGYPVLLAAVFMITGPCTGAVFLLNSIFALLGALAVWKLVKENWGEKQALLAALIWSIYPYFVYYSAYAMTDIIHISLLPVILLLTLRAAADWLGLTVWAMRERIWSGSIPVVRFRKPDGEWQRKMYIDTKDLESFIQNNKTTIT